MTLIGILELDKGTKSEYSDPNWNNWGSKALIGIWGALATQNHRGCESRAIFSAGFQPEPAEFRSAWLLDRSADRLTEGFQPESA